METFINESGLKFTDISSEKEREYLIFDAEHPLKIEGEPLCLNVKQKEDDTDSHRIFTSEGWAYYIKPAEGWAVRWKVKEGKPSFVKQMWTDRDTPGCKYDTIDCRSCGSCHPSPLDIFLEEKKEKEENDKASNSNKNRSQYEKGQDDSSGSPCLDEGVL